MSVCDVVIDSMQVTTKSGNVDFELPASTAFTLTHETKRGGVPTVDFPVTQEGNTYICGTNGIRIAVTTNSGKVRVTSAPSKS